MKLATIRTIGFAALFLAACAPKKEAVDYNAFDKTEDPTCYTVDLFDEPVIQPESNVPATLAEFSGVWGGGAWGGVWCHDLHVLEVKSDGSAYLVEAHAPYAPWGKPATAFKRVGQIGEDGRLRVVYGDVTAEYWLENGRMLGSRDDGIAKFKIALRRKS